jgi:hypothetical protein
MDVPKDFVSGIRVPGGIYEGRLAAPCLCGYETDLDSDDPIYLITWPDGALMFCHAGCIGEMPDAQI